MQIPRLCNLPDYEKLTLLKLISSNLFLTKTYKIVQLEEVFNEILISFYKIKGLLPDIKGFKLHIHHRRSAIYTTICHLLFFHKSFHI